MILQKTGSDGVRGIMRVWTLLCHVFAENKEKAVKIWISKSFSSQPLLDNYAAKENRKVTEKNGKKCSPWVIIWSSICVY